MTFENDFTAAVRRLAKQAQQKAVTEETSEEKRRGMKLNGWGGTLRVIVGGKAGAYDMGAKDDPDGIMVTLRDPK
jgi:hypothetical protein